MNKLSKFCNQLTEAWKATANFLLTPLPFDNPFDNSIDNPKQSQPETRADSEQAGDIGWYNFRWQALTLARLDDPEEAKDWLENIYRNSPNK